MNGQMAYMVKQQREGLKGTRIGSGWWLSIFSWASRQQKPSLTRDARLPVCSNSVMYFSAAWLLRFPSYNDKCSGQPKSPESLVRLLGETTI